jgi:beta-glucosidase
LDVALVHEVFNQTHNRLSTVQFEGAVKEGGRGPSIWDTASHIPGVIADNSTGDVTTDQYHRYKEDVELLVQLGVDAYRFSIAWSRIFPDGKGPIANKEGIAYYNRLIDALLENGTSLSSLLPNIWFKCLKALGFKDGLVLNLVHGSWIGIQPYVTLFHFDLPQAFQDSFGGWRSPLIV